jgi:DNA-binding transcriptional MerR regulator
LRRTLLNAHIARYCLLTVTLSLYILPTMDENEDGLTLEALAAEVGLSIRAVRFYITEKLLPPLGSRGKGAVWGEEHLLRLRLIRRLTERRMALAEIRDRLASLSVAEIRALLDEEDQQAQALARTLREPSAKEYLSTLLRQARAGRAPAPPAAAMPAPATVAPPAPPTVPAQNAAFDSPPGSYAGTAPASQALPASPAGAPAPAPAAKRFAPAREAADDSTPRTDVAPFAAKSAAPSAEVAENSVRRTDVAAAGVVRNAGPIGWLRHLLAPGVELHVQESALPERRALVDRLLAAADSARDEELESQPGLERNT